MHRSPNSLDTYHASLGIFSVPYKHLVIWINTFDQINRLVDTNMLNLFDYRIICQLQFKRSFQRWIQSSRLRGLLCLSKCVLLSFRKPIYFRIILCYFGILR